MKKLLTFSAMALLAVTAFGQGQVNFANIDKTAAPNILAPVYDGSLTGTLLAGTAARAALLGGPATGTAAVLDRVNNIYSAGTLSLLAKPGAASTTWVNFRTGAAAGYVVSDTRILNDVNYSTSAMLQMVAWTGNFNTWQDAFNAAQKDPTIKIGCSAAWNVTTTASATDPNLPRNIGLGSFFIAPIPEPTTMALAGLGAAALLIFRRRK